MEDESNADPGLLKSRDDLYEAAIDVVVREGRGSVSLLQRTLGIGYGRAARLIDYMAEDGFVGPYAGSQAREVQLTIADWEAMQAGGEPAVASPVSAPAPRPAAKARSNKVKPEPEFVEEPIEEPADDLNDEELEYEDEADEEEEWDDGELAEDADEVEEEEEHYEAESA